MRISIDTNVPPSELDVRILRAYLGLVGHKAAEAPQGPSIEEREAAATEELRAALARAPKPAAAPVAEKATPKAAKPRGLKIAPTPAETLAEEEYRDTLPKDADGNVETAPTLEDAVTRARAAFAAGNVDALRDALAAVDAPKVGALTAEQVVPFLAELDRLGA